MESPTILKFTISLSFFCMLLLFASTLNPVFGLKNCNFPAIFNFGDSNSDTGGLSASLATIKPPYGETYFHKPAGRASDGRLMIDFLAKSLGLPYLSAYLDSLGTNFTHGANFATYASTIGLPISIIPAGTFSPIYLNVEYSEFVQFKFRSQVLRQKAQRDSYGCAKPYNEVAQYFNHKLKEAIVQLRKDLPLAAITYVDIYSVKYSLYSKPKEYGFELPLIACCGYGGIYNYSSSINCGTTITVNGSQIFVGSCERPSVRVNWDGIHYTEAANKFVFDKISNGAFSDPPIPLKMACHKIKT
ncbi:hypothetical protein SO802_023056 [Lithocarpus litseifolius]|uniref:Uncharacterized protein n=1 Tax=Lithocarpus litseifolius TaxID=425828 RepID=A0AAW2C5X6_9ROSI